MKRCVCPRGSKRGNRRLCGNLQLSSPISCNECYPGGVGRGFIYNYNLHPEYRLYHVLLYLRCVPFFPRKLAGISCDGHVNRGKKDEKRAGVGRFLSLSLSPSSSFPVFYSASPLTHTRRTEQERFPPPY